MSTLTGLPAALRLVWRRNRVYWLCWTAGLALLMPLTLSQYDTILPPDTDPAATLEPLRTNPSMLALLGPAFDIYTKGGFVFWRVGGFASFFAGMMAAFGVIRATRAEEEDGHLELFRAGVLGRHAPLVAAVVVSLAATTLTGLLSAGMVIAAGLPVAGSLAAGLAIALVGWVFTGLAAVMAQVFETARAARYWTVGALWGGMFVIRMIVDGSGTESGVAWARWLLPIEWGVLVGPFASNRWWVLGLAALFTAACLALAFTIESRRDLGAGLVRPRPGRAHAPRTLGDAWGLAWRLQRGGLVGWTLALLLSASGTGSIIAQTRASIEDNPALGRMLEKLGGTADLEIGFYVAMLGILASIVAIMGATILSRLRSEETSGHLEQMLATATSRQSVAWSHLLWALLVPALVMVGVGAALPVLDARQTGNWEAIAEYTRGAAGLVPGVVLVVALAMALIGWLPRLFWIVWVVLGWSLFATWFSALLDLPTWLTRITPWGYLPHLPRDAMDWTPVLIESTVAVALLGVGLVGFRRRAVPS